VQGARDFVSHRHPTAREREHDQVATISKTNKLTREKSPGIGPIQEVHWWKR